MAIIGHLPTGYRFELYLFTPMPSVPTQGIPTKVQIVSESDGDLAWVGLPRDCLMDLDLVEPGYDALMGDHTTGKPPARGTNPHGTGNCVSGIAPWAGNPNPVSAAVQDIDVPVGQVTDFRKAVNARDDETVVLSWVEWPDKQTRDAAHAKMTEWMKHPDKGDPRMSPEKNPMPFDGKRLILGGFVPLVELGSRP